MSPSRCSACSTCRSSPSTTATSRRKARRSRNRTGTSARSARSSRRRWRRPRSASSGARRTSSPTAASWRARRPIPIPDVFAYAAAQVKNVLELTHELGGANYVLWGGREGYETLLNTDIKRELAQLGRFLTMVVEHKEKIGFKGTILIEPKPKEPTKHQYDYDVGTIYGMLKAFDLEKQGQDQHRAEPRHPRRPHLRARAGARRRARHLRLDRHQSRRLSARLGHRPVRHEHPRDGARLLLHPQGRRLHHRRLQFRRQDPPPVDRSRTICSIAHVGSMDACARGLLIAEKMITDGKLDGFVAERYAGWDGKEGKAILAGKRSLDDLSDYVLKREARAAAEERQAGVSRAAAQRLSSEGAVNAPSIGRKRPDEDASRGRRSFWRSSPAIRAPFNHARHGMAGWAAGLGYKGIQIPTWDGRLFDLKKAASSKTYCDEIKGMLRRGTASRSPSCRPTSRASSSRSIRSTTPASTPSPRRKCAAIRRRAPNGRSTRSSWAPRPAAISASTRMVTFTGAFAWPFLYPWPQRPAGPDRDRLRRTGQALEADLRLLRRAGRRCRLRAAPERGRLRRRHLRDAPRARRQPPALRHQLRSRRTSSCSASTISSSSTSITSASSPST